MKTKAKRKCEKCVSVQSPSTEPVSFYEQIIITCTGGYYIIYYCLCDLQRRAQIQTEDRWEIVTNGKICREEISKVYQSEQSAVHARH